MARQNITAIPTALAGVAAGVDYAVRRYGGSGSVYVQAASAPPTHFGDGIILEGQGYRCEATVPVASGQEIYVWSPGNPNRGFIVYGPAGEIPGYGTSLGVQGSGGDPSGGGDFTPTQGNLYNAVKAIFHPTTNPGLTADDANEELDVSGAVAPIYQRWLFHVSASKPPAPTSPNAIANAGDVPSLPTGWSYAPGQSSNPIWASVQTVLRDSTVVTYTDPFRLDGADASSDTDGTVPLWTTGQAWRVGALSRTSRGAVYVAQVAIDTTDASASTNPDDALPSLWRPIQGFEGSWVSGSDYHQGNIVLHSSRFYLVIQRVSNSVTQPQSDTTNFQLIGDEAYTDAEIGDIAFKNPPALNTVQQAAVRTAIGAGPGTNLDDLPIPEWTATAGYVAGELVRDSHNRVFMCIVNIVQSNNAPATDATHFAPVSGYAGDYADSTAYPRGELVTHSNNTYFVNAPVAATNTDDPTANSSFIRLNGGSVEANPDGSATDSLLKIGIDGTVYSLPTGSGDGSAGGTTTLYEDASLVSTRQGEIWFKFTMSRAPVDNALIEVYTRQESNSYGAAGATGPSTYVFNAKTWKELTAVVEGSEPATPTNANRANDYYLYYTGSVWSEEVNICRYSDTEMGLRSDSNTNFGIVEIREIAYGGGGTSSGGTTVEANPSGAVDSGALTKLDVDGSIYSVAAGTGGLSSVETDATLTGDGTSGDALSVANPFTAADETLLDGLAVDVIVFWSPTSEHTHFDAVGYGDTITINYGSSQSVDATVLAISRNLQVATLVIEPLSNWSAIIGGNTVIIEDSADNTIGSFDTASRESARNGITGANEWWHAESVSGAGDETWRELDRIDRLDNTHLTLGTRTATNLDIDSSTGNDVTLPSATTTLAGLESAADKTQLSASPPVWVSARAYNTGTQRVWQGRLYECIVDRTVADTDNPATDTTGWASVTAQGETDLSIGTRTGTTMVLASSSGSNATIPQATTSNAGLKSAADKTKSNALPDVWTARAAGWLAGEYCLYANRIYLCISDRESTDTTTPNSDSVGWQRLTGDQDLSGYVETSTLTSDYSTTTEMNTAIGTATADLITDRGAWSNSDTYAQHDFVRHSGAAYLALQAVNAGIEPGVTSGWSTSWYRVAYSAGAPSALTTPTLTGQVLEFPNIGGTTTSITLPRTGEADTAPATRVERVKFQAIAESGTGSYEGVPSTTNPVSVVYPDGAERSIITSLSGNDITLKAGVYLIDIAGTFTGSNANAIATFNVRKSSDNDILDRSTLPHIGTSGNTGSAYAQLVLAEDTAVNIALHVQNQRVAVAADWTATFTRWGGSNSFDPATLGVDTFPIPDPSVVTTVALTDDTSGNAIVCPETGWLVVKSLIPGLGLNNKIDWYFAADLRADKAAADGLYTNASDEIILQIETHSGSATTGNIVTIFYTGATTPGSITPPPPVSPHILRWRVTGDQSPGEGNIGGTHYSYELQISQSSHVGAARIVGFIGTSANPASVSQLQVVGDYSNESGTVTIPDPTNLESDQVYTLRLEVYPTGGSFADTPTIYADYRITAHGASLQTHFGRVLATDGAVQDQTDIVFATTDISTASAAAGTYTVQVPGPADTLYRLYWAVPSNSAQPTSWTTGGFNITGTISSVENVSIGGNNYTVYLTEADGPYDSSSNGTEIVVA